ncbi:MAG: hypothetical protein AMXMBFR84_14630 [Candidatus Hydrogenedentota bacterium]
MAGWAIEVIGVQTGYPFGAYHYTDALGPSFFGAPITMIAAWITIFAYAHVLISQGSFASWQKIVCGSLLLVIADLLVDPVAVGPMALWTWHSHGTYYGIPASNFLGWFLTGLFLFTTAIAKSPNHPIPLRSSLPGLTIILFFFAIALMQSMTLPAIAGVLLVTIHGVLVFVHVSQSGPAEETRLEACRKTSPGM